MFKLSDEEIQRLLSGIFSGAINSHALPEYLYYSLADALKNGLYKGFGIDFNTLSDVITEGASQFTTVDLELLTELRENVHFFSAAKTYQQVKEMNSLIVGKDSIRSFPEFKREASKIYETYNTNWLRTEYDTAIGQGQMAVKWNRIEAEKEILPFLRYSAVMDSNTSDICRPLNGITLPVGHALWKKYSPLNHFNCRCILEQLDDGKITPSHHIKALTKTMDERVDDVFKMNPGAEKKIFSDEHPYFDVDKKDRKLAERNFNLPVPAKD